MPGAAAASLPNEALTVSPSPVFATLAAGERRVVELTYQNQTGIDADVRVQVLDVAPRSGESESLELVAGSGGRRSASPWVSVDAPRFDVPAGDQHVVRVEVDVPADAGAGGYYAGLAIVARPTSPAAQFQLDARLEVPLLLTVDGKFRRAVSVDVVPDARVHWQGGPARWRVRISNDGDVHESISGTLSIDGMIGAARRVPLDAGVLLPGEHRTRSIDLSLRGTPDAYRASARVELDDHEPVVARADRVWVVPWWSIVLLVLAAGLVAWRIRTLRRGSWEEPDPEP